MNKKILENFTYDETIEHEYPEISYFFYSDNEDIVEELTGKKYENVIGAELEIVVPRTSDETAIYNSYVQISPVCQVDDGFEDIDWTRIILDEETIRELLKTPELYRNIKYLNYKNISYPIREVYFPKANANVIVATDWLGDVIEENDSIDEQIYCYIPYNIIFLSDTDLLQYLNENFD